MPKKLRDWLFIIFIILFCIITFFVALYAAGYSINRKWPPRFDNLFEKTGMLIIDSQPSGATIFLNGEKQKKFFLLDVGQSEITTPARIKNLPPGEYELRLEKEGYWPLEKKIIIKPGQSSFAEDFIIFKQSLPLNLALCKPQEMLLSPNQKSILLTQDALLIDLKTGSSSQLDINLTGSDVSWSENSNRLFINEQVLDLNNKNNQLNIPDVELGKDAYNFHWDEDNKKLYYQLEHSINCLNLDNNTAINLLSKGQYLAYTIKDNLIYTAEKEEEKYYLRTYDLNTYILQSNTEISNGFYSFQADGNNLGLFNKNQKELYILNGLASRPIGRKINNIIEWIWINEEVLLWRNDTEIYSMNIKDGRQNLIIRVSEALTGIAWNKAKSYLIYTSANNIWIVNLNLEKIIPIQLLKAEKINNLYLDEKNQIIYFYASIGQQSGIYKLQLQ